ERRADDGRANLAEPLVAALVHAAEVLGVPHALAVARAALLDVPDLAAGVEELGDELPPPAPRRLRGVVRELSDRRLGRLGDAFLGVVRVLVVEPEARVAELVEEGAHVEVDLVDAADLVGAGLADAAPI